MLSLHRGACAEIDNACTYDSSQSFVEYYIMDLPGSYSLAPDDCDVLDLEAASTASTQHEMCVCGYHAMLALAC